METSMMTSKGQVVVPSRLRKKYGIKPGLKIAFIERKDGVLLIPMDEAFSPSLWAYLKIQHLQKRNTCPGKEKKLMLTSENRTNEACSV